MYINKKLFNNIAVSEQSRLAFWQQSPSQLQLMSRCAEMFAYFDGLPAGRRIWTVIERLVEGIHFFAQDAHLFCTTDDNAAIEQLHNDYMRHVMCPFTYLADQLSLLPGVGVENMISLISSLTSEMIALIMMKDFSNDTKEAFCNSLMMTVEKLWAMDMEDWLKEYGQYMTLTPNPIPITCPTRIPVTVDIEWWESFLIWALDGVDPADMEAAGNAATCVGVLTGVLAASGPIFVCTTGVKGLSAATAALAVFVGVDRASAIENQLVMCTPDDNDICCAGGQVHEGWTFEECLEIGGAWGDPGDTECVPFSHE